MASRSLPVTSATLMSQITVSVKPNSSAESARLTPGRLHFPPCVFIPILAKSLPLVISESNFWIMHNPLARLVCLRTYSGATTTSAPQPTAEPPDFMPQILGIIAKCKSFHLIKDGNNCFSINTVVKITVVRFRAWNA